MCSWVSVSAQYNNSELLAESGGNLVFPREGKEAASWDISLPFPHQPDTFPVCPWILVWLRRDQGSLVLSWCGCGKSCGQDVGIAAKFILRLWCFAIACAAMRNAGVLVFCKKNFVRPTGETGMRGGLSKTKKKKANKKRTPKNYSCTSYSWEKKV